MTLEHNSEKMKQEFLEFEGEMLRMKHELQLKKKQVEQLRKDIDAERIKNHDLSRTVDNERNKTEETARNLNVALQNNQLLDSKLQEKTEETNKLRLQRGLAVNESNTLRDLLHKSEMEKFDLLHKVEDLEEENKRQQGFQKQLGNSEQKLLSLISEIKKEVIMLESKNENVTGLAKELKLSRHLHEQIIFLKSKLKRLEVEKQALEEKVTGSQTKYDKLKALIDNHQFLLFDNGTMPHLQYKKYIENHKHEVDTLKCLLRECGRKLSLEQEANHLLILRDENNVTLMNELRADLEKTMDVKDAEVQVNDVDILAEVKQEEKEIIEID